MGDTTPIPAPRRGLSAPLKLRPNGAIQIYYYYLLLLLLSWSANLTVQSVLVQFVLDQPLLPCQGKFENFKRKLPITPLVREIRPPFLHLGGGYRCLRI